MTNVTDDMFRFTLIGVMFLILMAGFNVLFIGGQISDNNGSMDLSSVLGASWKVLSDYPELLIIDVILGSVGLIGSLFIIRELLPV
jgi:hypothetical protein